MQKDRAKETIEIPIDEYRILKEVYNSVRRQRFLLRIMEAEKNFGRGKVKEVSVDEFINAI